MTESSHAEGIPELLPRLRAIVASVAGSRDVDDLVQECCVRILEKESQFRDEGAGFAAWASAVARNLSRNFRTRNRRGQEETMEHAEQVPADELGLDEQRVGWILDQLGRLPEDERHLLRLRYFDGLTVEQVGAELGLSQAGASKRLDRALSVLRERAGRQGWLGALLPASWAASLAGTSPMKLTLAGAAALTATFGASFFLVDPETPVQGDTSSMERTSFVPSLDASFDPKSNALWCGSLQLACRALVEAAGERHDPSLVNEMARLILEDPFGAEHIDAASFVAVGGLDTAALIESAQAQLIEKFDQGRDPVLDAYRGTDMPLAYAFLARAMRFGVEFDDHSDRPFTFGADSVDVESWGLLGFDEMNAHQVKQAAQLRVLHYGGPEDFILELMPEGRDRIVLARTEPGKSLSETWKRVQSRRESHATLSELEAKRLAWREGDQLWIPKLDFDLSHVFSPLELGVEGVSFASALQSLRVRLDHRGAEIKSRTMVLRGSIIKDPKRCVFDGPFLAAFVREDSAVPYSMLWVADAELLVPRESQAGTAETSDGGN